MPLGGAVALLVLAMLWLIRMGIVMLPEMASDSIQVAISTPEGVTRSESYEMADEAIRRLMEVSVSWTIA